MPLPYTSLHTMPSLKKVISALFCLSLVWLLAGCSTQQWLTAVRPYKVEVVQGNFVSTEMVDQLKPGMTKDQVADLLGTPLLVSVFRTDRWEYTFTFKRQGLPPQSRRLTVFFKGNLFDRFEGDALPSEKEFVDSIYTKPFLSSTPKLELTEQEKQELTRPATP